MIFNGSSTRQCKRLVELGGELCVLVGVVNYQHNHGLCLPVQSVLCGMNYERDFVVMPEVEKVDKKTTKDYERQEMLADISVFPKASRLAIQRWLDGRSTKEDQAIIDKARSKWWQEKYGFSYTMVAERQATLLRKHAPQQEISDAQKKQKELFLAVQGGDENNIARLRKEYEEAYPEQLEGVTALFELSSFFETRDEFESIKNERFEQERWHSEAKPRLRVLTEYQFLLTDFVANNTANKEFLRAFWSVCEQLSDKSGHLKDMHKLQRGVLSQVAIYKVLEKLGMDSRRIAHPDQDAFDSVDLWIQEGETAIQIKGGIKDKELIFEPTETISFPGVQTVEGDRVQHLNSFMSQNLQRFRVKVNKLKKKSGKNVKGYLVGVPYSKFDFITGEPTDDIVQFIGEKLGIEKTTDN